MSNINVNEILKNYNEEDRDYIVNIMKWNVLLSTNAPQNDEEFKNFCEATLKARDEERKKEAERKEKAAQKEKEKAANCGMTIEEYKVYKKRQAKIKRLEKEIADAEWEIQEMEKAIAKKRKDLEKLKEEG